jgi:hypothetical protein
MLAIPKEISISLLEFAVIVDFDDSPQTSDPKYPKIYFL